MNELSSESFKKIVIASDHAGVSLKQKIMKVMLDAGWEVLDLGTDSEEISVDYPEYAQALAKRLTSTEKNAAGILICGTGGGMCIAANRMPGVRAAVCTEVYSVEMSRKHNDANVLCLGARVVGQGQAERLLRAFLETSFEGGRHMRRVEKMENFS